MLTDEKQLELKREVIVKAYQTYSCRFSVVSAENLNNALPTALPASSIPPIENTVQSPLLYNYRTKITPHFERPLKAARSEIIPSGEQPSWLKIGFNQANNKLTIDIEVCFIYAVNDYTSSLFISGMPYWHTHRKRKV